MTIVVKNKQTLFFDDFNFNCCIGKKGLTKNKIEGDKKTPIGFYSLGNLYYRADRVKKPETSLKCIKIKKSMGWCNDINNKFYNKEIKIKKRIQIVFRNELIIEQIVCSQTTHNINNCL